MNVYSANPSHYTQQSTGHSQLPNFPFTSPAERVLTADPSQLQTVWFLLIFIGAVRHDCLPASFSTAVSLARAEEQTVAVLSGHTVQEHPQGFVAALFATGFTLVGILLAAGYDVAGALLLAAVVEVAGFGCIKTGVAVLLGLRAVETFWCYCEHSCKWTHRGHLSDFSGPKGLKSSYSYR